LIDAQRIAFVTGGVSILAASRGSHNIPVIARAAGCRVCAGRERLALFLATSQAAALLEGVRTTGAIAAVFSQPSTHRTLQLKGGDGTVQPLQAGDAQAMARYAALFAAEFCVAGYPEALARALVWAPETDFVAVCFTPTAAFDQTPGPRAGARLEA
jgi:hypothetical protein